MFVLNSGTDIIMHISNFDTYVDIVCILDINMEKPINKMSEDEINEFISNAKNKNKLFLTSKYSDDFLDKIKLIPYTSQEIDNEMLNIKILDKEEILPQTSKFFIIDVDNEDINYVFSSNKVKDRIEVKKTASNYFNFKIKNKNQIFVYENADNIVLFYEVSSLKSK